MTNINNKTIRARGLTLALLAASWLLPTAAEADDPDAAIRKGFPKLYGQIQPYNLTRVHVNWLNIVLGDSGMGAEDFRGKHGRYPSSMAELMPNIHDENADQFDWSLDGGGGSFPTIRAVYRKDPRIAGYVNGEGVTLPDSVKRLRKDATCQADTHLRDFLRDADAETGARFMQVLGAPAGTSREAFLASVNEGVKRDCR